VIVNWGKYSSFILQSTAEKYVQFQKISLATPRKVFTEIPRGKRVSKAKPFEGKFKSKLKFPEEWGASNYKSFHGRGKVIFWDSTIVPIRIDINA